ncbi:MAG: nicotinamide-nucleotide amidohydrolase family protein [Methylococcaceae bacterium]|nr:nicotinamide-nucleotide amidohydrolase family protein [Methylococcaceae bacterium]
MQTANEPIPSDDDLYALAARVGFVLMARAERLVVAESCTGGWIAQCVTDVAGSSQWFERGYVTYSNESKSQLLAVPQQILEHAGAVSEATVAAMAAGALRASGADCAAAVSGIAGPGGGSAEKPVGTVCFAWQRRIGEAVTLTRNLTGDRRAVRRQAVAIALGGVLDLYG